MKYIQALLLNLILFSILGLSSVNAQSDSIVVSETVEDSIDFNYMKKYKYLENILNDDKTIFKLGGETYLLETGNYSVGFGISFEQKISKSFSIIAKYHVYDAEDFKPPYKDVTTNGFCLQLRYYPRKAKQIKNNTSGNNTLGFYFLAGLQDIIATKDYVYSDDKDGFKFEPFPQLGAGYQYIINKNLFIDINAYGGYYSYSNTRGTTTSVTAGRVEASINYTFRPQNFIKTIRKR